MRYEQYLEILIVIFKGLSTGRSFLGFAAPKVIHIAWFDIALIYCA